MIVFHDSNLAMTVRAQGYGVATAANIWVCLFPLTMLIVYCFCTASLDSFVGKSAANDQEDDLDYDNAEGGGHARNVEMKSLVEHDQLVEVEQEPYEPMRRVDLDKPT